MVNPDGPPMSGSQSRAKGSSIALVLPLSILRQAGAGSAVAGRASESWLLWNYSENIRWEHRWTITRWAWEQFNENWPVCALQRKQSIACVNLSGWRRRMSKQNWQGRGDLNTVALAELVGEKSTWTETYLLPHWLALRSSF